MFLLVYTRHYTNSFALPVELHGRVPTIRFEQITQRSLLKSCCKCLRSGQADSNRQKMLGEHLCYRYIMAARPYFIISVVWNRCGTSPHVIQEEIWTLDPPHDIGDTLPLSYKDDKIALLRTSYRYAVYGIEPSIAVYWPPRRSAPPYGFRALVFLKRFFLW